TRSWSAAYVSGALAGFNAHVLVELPHLQFQHFEFIPLVLFALDRVVVSRRVRDGCWLGVGYALQSLTSVYGMGFTGWMVLVAALGRARSWTRERPARTIALFAVAASIALLLMGPYLAAYSALHKATGFERAVTPAAGLPWADFLQSGSRLYFPLWGYR